MGARTGVRLRHDIQGVSHKGVDGVGDKERGHDQTDEHADAPYPLMRCLCQGISSIQSAIIVPAHDLLMQIEDDLAQLVDNRTESVKNRLRATETHR
jgi:hypothetical protein